MNHKEIEQAIKGCLVNSKKRLLADKDFLHFLHYFPAGVSDEVKRYFNQVVTGKENFFMVPDRKDKQKAICSRCGKNIILPSDLRHKDRAVCPSCLAFSNDETAKIARQAHKEGLLVKGAGKR